MTKLGKFVNKLKINNFWKSVVVLVSGSAFAQLIGIFTTPIVSRLYDPNAYGDYAIIVSTSTIIISIVTIGLNAAIMTAKSEEEGKKIFMVSFTTIVVFTTFILFILAIISSSVRLFDYGESYLLALLFIYLFVIINSIKGILYIFANRMKNNRVLFYNSIIGALATLFITIPFGYYYASSIGLILASLLGGVISIIQMVYHVNPFGKIPNLREMISVYTEKKDFILYQYPSNFLENFAVQLPTQFLSAFFGNANLGSYSMNEKILGIPVRLIGAPISTIYFRTASDYHKQGKDLSKFTFSLISKIMLLAFIPVVVTIIWGEIIFATILGNQWAEAGKIAGFLIVQYVFVFCSSSTSYLRVTIGKQRISFILSIIRLIIVGGSISAGYLISGSLITTIIVLSAGISIYLIIDMTINFYCLGKYWLRYLTFATIYMGVIIFLWILVK